MTPPPPRRSHPSLHLEGLTDLVAAETAARPRASSFRPPRAARHATGWRLHFAGWMGLMFGPVPIGHLALGLLGLYFKLR